MFNKNPTHLLRQLLELIVAEIQKLEFSSNLDPGREGAKLIGAQIKLKQDWEKVYQALGKKRVFTFRLKIETLNTILSVTNHI